MTGYILSILNDADINPESIVDTDSGEQTAFQYLEARIIGAIDDIEESVI